MPTDPDVDRRLNYFTGQLLQEQDFHDEQAYHLDRLRRHNRQLHTPGITDGLEVDAQLGAPEVTVSKGTAVDDEGRLIVLPAEKKVGLDGGDPRDDADANGVVTRTLVISYHEVPSDPSTVGGTGDTRIHEDPSLALVKQPSTGQVPLVLLTIDADGKVKTSDPSVRGQAGARLGGDVEVGRLTISRLGIDPTLWPSLSVGDGGGLAVKGTIRLSDQDVFLRGGTDATHGIGWYGGTRTWATRNLNGPVVYGYGGGGLGSTNGGQKLALSWDNSQNVSVAGGLTVTGLLSIPGGARLNGGDVFLRGGTDNGHGIGWYGGAKVFSGRNVDGPIVYGFSGGGLGSTNGGQKLALAWDNSQNVSVAGGLTVTGLLTTQGGVALNDQNLLLRASGDAFHGIGFYGGTKTFSDRSVDGPVMWGHSGGVLGTLNGGQKIALSWDANQNVSAAAGLTVTGVLSVQSDARLNDKTIYLRGSTDNNHGIGWYGGTGGTAKQFATRNVDGPVLFGYSGGALGSTSGGQKIALSWDYNQNVYYKQRPIQVIQSGTASVGDNNGNGERNLKAEIIFPFAFSSPPQVFIALSELDVDHNLNLRVRISTTSITATGFTVIIGTWGDTHLYSTGISWIAYGTPT